jgi:hypothetical protein
MSTSISAELGAAKSSIIEEIKSLSAPESGSKEQKLFVKDENNSRQTNYVGWAIKTETYLRKKKCLDIKDKVISGKESDALDYLIGCISDELLEIIPKAKRATFTTLWEYLPTKCRIGNRWDLEREFGELNIDGVDMLLFCEQIDRHIAKTERAGGVISHQSHFDLLMKKANPIFYKDTIKDFRRRQQSPQWAMSEAMVEELRDALHFEYENSPAEVKAEYSSKTANSAVTEKKRSKRKEIPEAEHCSYCKTHRSDKPQLAKSHRAKDCFFGDVPGLVKANKAESNYSSLHSIKKKDAPILDTGANGSFSKDKPTIDFKPDCGQVQTANSSSSAIKGKGITRIGKTEIETKWVPDFTKTLVNDSDMLKENKYIVITRDKFVVLDSKASLQIDPKTVIASGFRNSEDLLAFDEITNQEALNPS